MAPALAFLAGVASSDPSSRGALFVALAAIVPFLAGRPTARRALGVILSAALGGIAGWYSDLRYEARVAWLPADGRYVERELRGRIVEAPLVDLRGDRVVTIAARPPGGRGAEARIKLRVRSGEHHAWLQALDALGRGDVIRVYARVGVPRRPDSASASETWRALRARGIDATGWVKSAGLIARESGARPSAGRTLESVRIRLRGRLRDSFPDPGPTRALVTAMLLGECNEVRPETYRVLRDAGLSHLISISGLHVGLLILTVLAALRRTSVPIAVSAALAVAGLAAFGFMVGARAPVLRAVGCAAVALLGRVLNRDGNAVNTVTVIAAALAAAQPSLLADVGFRLTFLAVFGILLLAGPIADLVPLHRSVGTSVGVSAGAYLATVCAVAWHFGRLAPVALVSNLVAVPLCGWILAAGGAALALEPVPLAGPLSARAAEAGVGLLLGVADAAASIPGASFRVAPPAPWMAAICYLLLGLTARLSAARRGPRRRAGLRVAGLALTLVLARLHLGPWPGFSSAELVVVDVGQGQAVVLKGSRGGCVLIDAGGTSGGRFDAGERVVTPWLASSGCRRLAALVVTHDHDDHAGGAPAILREFEVDELWYPVATHRRRGTSDLIDLARASGAGTVAVERGFEAYRAGMRIEVLHPTRDDLDLGVNDRSIVVRVTTEAGRVLIAGDMGTPGERRVLAADLDADSSILVVGHHGADGASSSEFLRRVRPHSAVISVGAWNRFGHPSRDVLERLTAVGARIYRTDRNGSIRFRGSQGGWEVKAERVSPPAAAWE